MEIKKLTSNFSEILKKYRYAILVLLIGILLMNIPSGKTAKKQEKETVITLQPAVDMEKRLVEVLGQIEGVGRVEVMLTQACGEENVYQSNEELSTDESGRSQRKETVTMTDSDRNETALILKTNAPKYLGAIIVCEGAESSAVRLSLVDAVSKITGLKSDAISVLKMK
ncbi:MAG: hypothetical protein IKW10_04520 [Oscillospiraceae bacterium]|nr:hypothetical protein [Oscillospiraceae bacterium]